MTKPVRLTVFEAPWRDVMDDIVRVDMVHRPFAKAGRVIVIHHQENKALAVARGPAGVGSSGISMDTATRQKLKVAPGKEFDFRFSEANLWDQINWAWHASNAMPRIAARLAVMSVALGFLGLVLGIVSLIVAFA